MPGGLTLLASANADIPTPASGKVTIFFSTDANLPVYKDDAGMVHSLVGSTGPVGPTGVQGEQGDEPDQVLALPGPQGNPGPTGSQGPMGVSMVQEELFIPEIIPFGPGPSIVSPWDLEVVKGADEQVINSNAYIEDAALFLPSGYLQVSSVYVVEGYIILSCDSTAADYKWEWRFGANLTNINQMNGYWTVNGSGPTNETATAVAPNAFWGNLVVQTQATHVPLVLEFRFTLVTPSSFAGDGQLHYRFAQNAAGGAGTEAITYRGSRFRIKKIA